MLIACTRTHAQETVVLPLDDLLEVTREFICPYVSRSGLDRCLRRHELPHAAISAQEQYAHAVHETVVSVAPASV